MNCVLTGLTIFNTMETYLHNADTKAIEAGVPTGPVVASTKAMPISKKTGVFKTPAPEIACQTRVPGSASAEPTALLKGIFGCVKTNAEIETSPVITSTDGRVIIKKRDTFKSSGSGAYGAVSAVYVDGLIRSYFKHYPVHFLDREELLDLMKVWACNGLAKPAWDEEVEIREMEPQFDGICIKVLADNDGNLRYVTKKKAQLCKEHEELFLDTLVANCPLEDAETAVKAALMTYALQGDVLTFRLVHPKVSYVNGPVDLSKPVAMLCAINDKHIRSAGDLPLGSVFMTPMDMAGGISIEQVCEGAVMAELYNRATRMTSYIKLVTHKLAADLKLLEGINGNLRQHLARTAEPEKLRAALHPYHLTELDAAIKTMADGPLVVERFVKNNLRELRDEKDASGLRAALHKMDTKRTERLLTCTKRGDFKAKGEMMASHIKLLVETVQAKLVHPKPEVAAAAKLVKARL